MAIATKSYNPGFLTDGELEEMFCVRIGEFESLLETLRENTGESNQHAIVVGPRGSGKTTLLLRLALEVRTDPDLSSRLHPIIFAEESYSVSTCGEFWLECLTRLAHQVPYRAEEPDLRRTVEDVRRERNDHTLRERCLGALLDFAEREGKRLVLQVENLSMLFSDMMDPDAGWCLRKTLQTEPRIMMIGSATSRFGEIDRPDRALYDLFRILQLHPLDRNESAVLCERVSGRSLDDGMVRQLQILTGGSPRLLAIVARFGAARSFRNLLSDLLDLVDEHTAYFKSHVESLPAQERRVYLALAELWKPAIAREVADRARMETSKCSAQLGRLMGRGVVSDAGGTNRRKQYYVSERLYNIYYLLRRSRGMDSLVAALVKFMDAYYSPAELQRGDEAIMVCEETWNRFGNHESFRDLQPALMAMTVRGAALSVQGRIREHLAACEELLNGLDRLDRRALAGKVADYDAEAVSELRLRTHEIRVLTCIKEGDVPAVAEDVRALLRTLPRLAAMPKRSIRSLMAASFVLGIDRMAALIRESPSADHLLPLTTALDLEMGEDPRVAIEIRKVAEDMRCELAEIREQMRVE